MKMRNQIVIQAPAQRIFALAGATENWPRILPHYRFVRVLMSDGPRRVVDMGARRGFIPVRWRAEQLNDATVPEIFFRHVKGWTAGMNVRWHFEETAQGTHVSIDHEFRSLLAPFIGRFFVDPIATRTLARMKVLAEAKQ